ncbi:unnamed protein product [Adineta steineri]|uniref:Acyltransferase 3 domain-containing protein n=1 Tax=Adineta steineri TaxID=433720 RepID=A0A815RA22_9BILA|nr:unnamed protein product [Adineta steineri]CAF1636786.1 unnamed protein product [Adineta steineri]
MEISPTVNTEENQSTRRPIIHVFTGFRALACLWIFMLHSVSTKELENLFLLQLMPLGGSAGVVLFFCLSGFVMVWTYGDCKFKSAKCYWSFIGRRAARLFPLYYFSLFLSIYDIRYVWRKDEPCTKTNVIFIMLTLFTIQTWVPYNFGRNLWNEPVWSVQTEWFFYLVFPFLLRLTRYFLNTSQISLLTNRNDKKKALKRLYLMWFLVLCMSVIPVPFQFRPLEIGEHKRTTDPYDLTVILYISPLTRIPEFLLGMLTGIIFILKSSPDTHINQSDTNISINLLSSDDQQPDTKFSSSLCSNYNRYCFILDIYFLIGILFFICSSPIFYFYEFVEYHAILRMGSLMSFMMCTYLYLSARYPSSLTSRLLTRSLLIKMGEISYAFYCLSETLPKVYSLLVGIMIEKSIIMKLFAGIGIAVFARRFIEMPFYTWVNKKLPRCQCR